MRRLLGPSLALVALLATAPARADGGARVDLQDPSGRLYGPNYPFPSEPVDQNGNPLGVQGNTFHVTVDGGSVSSNGGGASTPTGTPGDGKTAASAVPVMGFDDKALASQTTLALVLNALGGGGVLAVPTIQLGTAPAAGSAVIPTTDTADGAANTSTSAVALAGNGTGLLGWLSTIAGELGSILTARQPIGTQAVGVVALSTTAASIYAAAPSGTPRARVVLANNDYQTPTGGAGIVEWCSWMGTASVRNAGSAPSFMLLPGQVKDLAEAGVPQGALSCVAESGTPKLYWETY